MYAQAEIKSLVKLFEDQRLAEEKLESFCRPIATRLGFDNIIRVGIMDDDVFFTAEWHGPYQSSDVDSFYFPVNMLTRTQDEVFQRLDAERKKKNEDVHAQRMKEREKEEKELLANLKKKYE